LFSAFFFFLLPFSKVFFYYNDNFFSLLSQLFFQKYFFLKREGLTKVFFMLEDYLSLKIIKNKFERFLIIFFQDNKKLKNRVSKKFFNFSYVSYFFVFDFFLKKIEFLNGLTFNFFSFFSYRQIQEHYNNIARFFEINYFFKSFFKDKNLEFYSFSFNNITNFFLLKKKILNRINRLNFKNYRFINFFFSLQGLKKNFSTNSRFFFFRSDKFNNYLFFLLYESFSFLLKDSSKNVKIFLQNLDFINILFNKKFFHKTKLTFCKKKIYFYYSCLDFNRI
jgi:hypothetical protein